MITRNGYLVIYGSLTLAVLSIFFSIPWLYVFSLSFIFIFTIEAIIFYNIRKSIDKIEIERNIEEELHRLKDSKVILRVKSQREFPYIVILDCLPTGFEVIGGNIGFLGRLPKGETIITYTIRPKEIGKHVFRFLKIIAFDTLHFFYTEKTAIVESLTYCYPTTTSSNITNLIRRAQLYSEIGIRSAKKRGEGFEFYSTREYAFGDDLKRIAWHQVAKSPERKLFIIEREEDKRKEFRIFIPIFETLFEGLEGNRKIDYIAESLITFSLLTLRINTLLETIFATDKGLTSINIRTNHDLSKLIKFLGEIEMKRHSFDETKIFEEVAKMYNGSFILLITDRGLLNLKFDELEKTKKKIDLEVILLKTIDDKIFINNVLEFLKRYDNLKLNKIKYNLNKININSIVINKALLLEEITKAYNKEKMYFNEFYHGTPFY
ncbi:MAG TPA: DUF58 domain-containing protein [Geobacterales bacterium]|nr:DUF58 domain-containing protein [Geobacterales bacterium]